MFKSYIFFILLVFFYSCNFNINQNSSDFFIGSNTYDLKLDQSNKIFNKGLNFVKKSNYNEALIYFLEVNKLEKDNVMVLNNLGMCYNRLNDFKNAEYFFLKSLEFSKDDIYIPAVINAGNLYFDLKKYESSEYILLKYSEKLYLNPFEKEAIFFSLSKLYFEIKDISKTEQYMDNS